VGCREIHIWARKVFLGKGNLCIRLTGSKQHCRRHLCRGSDDALKRKYGNEESRKVPAGAKREWKTKHNTTRQRENGAHDEEKNHSCTTPTHPHTHAHTHTYTLGNTHGYFVCPALLIVLACLLAKDFPRLRQGQGTAVVGGLLSVLRGA
jgi:ABC-type nickel/cobalt efflux system permease component RcnA